MMNFPIGKLAVITAVITSLSGCFLYKPDIQQGNLVTAQMISELQPGMTKREVSRILGSPLINDPFNKDRWDFYYSMKDGKTGQAEQVLTSLIFKDDLLDHFSSTLE